MEIKTPRACNLCKKFKGFGLHWFSGCCPLHKDLSLFDYPKIAKDCAEYETEFKSACVDCKKNETCKRVSPFVSICSDKE